METGNEKVRFAEKLSRLAVIGGNILWAVSFVALIAYALQPIGKSHPAVGAMFLLLIPVFIAVAVIGKHIKRRLTRFRKYMTLIYGQQIVFLGEIAARTSKNLFYVRNDLQMMIRKGYFDDLEIDMAANKVISGSATAQAKANEGKYAEFTCPGCGAVGVKLKGEQRVCEYCGRTFQ